MNRNTLSSRQNNSKPTKQPSSGVNTLLSTLTHQPPAQTTAKQSSRPTTATVQQPIQQQPREQLHQITIQQSQNTLKQAQQTLQNANQLNKPQSKQNPRQQDQEFNKSQVQFKQQPQQLQQPQSIPQKPSQVQMQQSQLQQQTLPKKQGPPSTQQQRPQSSQQQKKNVRAIEPDSTEPLYECPEGCGRSFNEIALAKHAKICKKVFQQKRKEFNSAKQRVGEEIKKIETKSRKQPPQKQQQQQHQGKPKWKAQSEAFRAIIRQNKGGQLTKEETASISQMTSQDLVQCKFCGRKFNETAAKKHVQFCENKSKENKIKQGQVQKGSAIQATSKPTALSNNQKLRK